MQRGRDARLLGSGRFPCGSGDNGNVILGQI